MAEYTVKFSIKDKIISIIFFTIFGVMGYGLIGSLYRGIVVINCQPLPQEVICKISSEFNVLEIPKTQLSKVKTIEGKRHKGRKTEREILITTDHREIPLTPDYSGYGYIINPKERINTFLNDPQAKTLTIDGRQNFVLAAAGCSVLTTFILCFIFQDAWIDPRRKRR
jgi:hypothetical protein